MIKTLTNLLKQDKEKFVVQRAYRIVFPLPQSMMTVFSVWARTSIPRVLSSRILTLP